MYSTVGLLKNSKHSGRLVGTHQKLDRAAHAWFSKIVSKGTVFPSAKEIIYFEGTRGPDGLKRKSPGVDEPTHFILPDADDGRLVKDILDHQHNLHSALLKQDKTRTAFEAAWLAHAITDGLTPAHHYPYQKAVSELMSDKEYVTIFGQPVKGIMHGKTFAETARNNWIYWGVEGIMSKHIVFEYGEALVAKSTPNRRLIPHLSKSELEHINDYHNLDLKSEFYASLHKIHSLKMYDRFRAKGWTAELALESRQILLPEIVKMITIGWLSSLPTKAEIADYAQKEIKKKGNSNEN
ncbi:hypothetical protein IJH16_01865 [Candidatus Saccharibacteria bacterium]|nr:hypothetical protein [Candidatus Saccharibacteria bacterium]